MLRVAPVAVALGLLGSAHAGFAADGWLDWSSPSALCGDASAFSARVERALGRSPALAAAGAHVNVSARVVLAAVAGSPHWVGQVHLLRGDGRALGSRTIDRGDASCQPMVEALAVVTALALADDGIVAAPAPAQLDAGAATSPVPQAPAPPEAPPPRNMPPPVAPVAALSRSPAPVAPRWRSGVTGGLKVGFGLLPRPALGAEVSAYLRTANGWKVFLAIDGWQRQSSLDELGRGASLQRLEVNLGLCPLTFIHGSWDGAACLTGDLGRLSITGDGLPTASTRDRLVLDAGGGAELRRHLFGPVTAGLTAAVTAPLIRDRVSYGTTDGGVVQVFRESPAVVTGSLRLAVAF